MERRARPNPPLLVTCLVALAGLARAQPGTVTAARKISAQSGDFGGDLASRAHFGTAAAALGDLDGDGVGDGAVGAVSDGTTGAAGAVWILFMRADGTVRAEQEIGSGTGGFGGVLAPGDRFGSALAALGDLDGDGVTELAVGAAHLPHGSIWILFLDTDGTVHAERELTEGEVISGNTGFGASVASLGDVDGDGVPDLVAGTPEFLGYGALVHVFLHADGSIKGARLISRTTGGSGGGGFGGVLLVGERFGAALASPGDVDGDGILDLAVGSNHRGAAPPFGAIWILLLDGTGRVRGSHVTEGGPGVHVSHFGSAVARTGDLDGDGVPDVAVGEPETDLGHGALWILFLNPDGSARVAQPIGDHAGGLEDVLDDFDAFGASAGTLGDLDGDGLAEIGVGTPGDDDGAPAAGALWILSLAGSPPCFTLDFETEDDFETPLVNGQHLDVEFGRLVALASAGPNAGLAIFDSDAGGPNDPSQDLDLLVGTGNVLILQTENFPPDGNDVFPRPNDDEDGGTISFLFERPLAPQSLALIDLDAGDGTTRVELRDVDGRLRTYVVPANWTGDRALGQPGRRTLDLTALEAQPGFGSVATASEEPGFDPAAVERLDVVLDGSGALDDLGVCLVDLPRASLRTRTGSGTNPRLLTAATRPVLGDAWTAELDCRAFGHGRAVLTLRRLPAPGAWSPYGEVLIAGELLEQRIVPYATARTQASWNLPFDLALCGLELHVQGLCAPQASGGGKVETVGRLSNALALRLGF